MPVLTFSFGALEANAHLLFNSQDAVIADPPDNTALVLDASRGKNLTLRAILLTHMHFDHVSGAAAMAAATGLPIFVGKEDWDARRVFLSQAPMFGLPQTMPFEAEVLAPGSCQWGSLTCEVLHTPGHSPGSLCYYFPDEKAVLAGDVLFYRSVGRPDLPGGDADTLAESIRTKLYTLPAATVVHTGHYQSTTIGDEAAQNPFVRKHG